MLGQCWISSGPKRIRSRIRERRAVSVILLTISDPGDLHVDTISVSPCMRSMKGQRAGQGFHSGPSGLSMPDDVELATFVLAGRFRKGQDEIAIAVAIQSPTLLAKLFVSLVKPRCMKSLSLGLNASTEYCCPQPNMESMLACSQVHHQASKVENLCWSCWLTFSLMECPERR